jgi:hypothetical protein
MLLAAVLAACSGPPSTPDAGDAGPTSDAGSDAGSADAGEVMTATMGLFQTATSDGGVRLQSFVSVGPRAADDDGGCVVGPRAKDRDAAWLRISGYAAPGQGQPIVCMNEDGGYVCRFPSGIEVNVEYDAGVDALGTGQILFATGGGADVGAATALVTPPTGTLSATLDGGTLSLSCTDDCSSARVIVIGDTLSCDLAFAASITLPEAPGALSVVRAVSASGHDNHGAVLVGRSGRGVSLP